MKSKQPLNDSWLFWNAERLEDFPHVSERDYACATVQGDAEEGEHDSSRPAMVEDLLLCVGGVSAAIMGVGLAALIGSFISAYSALNGSGESRHAAVPPRPYLSHQRAAPSAKSVPPKAIVLGPASAGTLPGGRQDRPAAPALPATRRVYRARAEHRLGRGG